MSDLQLSPEQIENLLLITVGIYKTDDKGKLTDSLKKVANMLYFTIGSISDSQDAKILKAEAQKQAVTTVLSKDDILKSVNFFLKSNNFFGNGDVESLMKSFVKKELEEKITRAREEYSDEEISILKQILRLLEKSEVNNPLFVHLVNSIITTIKIIVDIGSVEGDLVEKEYLDQGIEALKSCKSLPDEIHESIAEYLSLQNPGFLTSLGSPSVALKELNFVLFGEPGKGKSTFINALKCYLQYPTYKRASTANDFKVACPVNFTLCFKENDDFFDLDIIFLPESQKEDNKFSFILNEVIFNFTVINFPEDSERLEESFKNPEVDAFLFVLKSTDTRINFTLLSFLKLIRPEDIKKLKFIFTGCISYSFTPGLALDILKRVEIDINGIDHHNCIHCIDNFGFRY